MEQLDRRWLRVMQLFMLNVKMEKNSLVLVIVFNWQTARDNRIDYDVVGAPLSPPVTGTSYEQ